MGVGRIYHGNTRGAEASKVLIPCWKTLMTLFLERRVSAAFGCVTAMLDK